MIAFDGNPTIDINSEEVNAPGDIYIADSDGTHLRRLTQTLDAGSPAWSPDGTQIAFVRANWRGNYERSLWVMDADGSRPRALVTRGPVGAPTWSPDGTRLAFGVQSRGLWVLDLATLRPRRLPFGAEGWFGPVGPRWSADGAHLLVGATKKGPGPDDYTRTSGLFTVDATTGGHAAQIPGARNLLGWDWSWTNCRVILAQGLQTRGASCAGNVYATDANLQHPTLLLRRLCAQSEPVWSPDGRQFAYIDHGAVWVANADGSEPHQVVQPLTAFARHAHGLGGVTGSVYSPAWQPVP
ncbi:LpqB family beta-propeller domain-containing protein [Marmoricola sp. URHB0036]|uniref:TolB family protein n=1 Tax=Marmoricola sp. URHB0036 TaxID=1298863 RepID=UPI000421054C|nr:LpqB family beta-propeller domain-containing protein [Marmoricola sp. URHB0036]